MMLGRSTRTPQDPFLKAKWRAACQRYRQLPQAVAPAPSVDEAAAPLAPAAEARPPAAAATTAPPKPLRAAPKPTLARALTSLPPTANPPTFARASTRPPPAEQYQDRLLHGDYAGWGDDVRASKEYADVKAAVFATYQFPQRLFALVNVCTNMNLDQLMVFAKDDDPSARTTCILVNPTVRNRRTAEFTHLFTILLVAMCEAAGLSLASWQAFLKNVSNYRGGVVFPGRQPRDAERTIYVPGVNLRGVDFKAVARRVRSSLSPPPPWPPSASRGPFPVPCPHPPPPPSPSHRCSHVPAATARGR